MAIPSDALFDSTARVWSLLRTRGEVAGTEITPEPVGTFSCRVTNPAQVQLNHNGAGLSPAGTWKVFALAADVTIEKDNVIQVLTGNEAGALLYVDRAYEPRSPFGTVRRMWQCVCRQWDGELPPVGGSS